MFKQHYSTTVINKYKTFKYSYTGIQNVNYRMVCDVFASVCLKAALAFLKKEKEKKKKKHNNKELTLVLLREIIDKILWGKDRLVKYKFFLY